MDQNKKQKKVSLVMGLLLVMTALFIDLLDILLLLLDFVVIGIVLSVLSGFFKFIVFKLWFAALDIKGYVPLVTQLIAGGIEAIPAIGVIPVTTLMVIVVIILGNSEWLSKITERASKASLAGAATPTPK